MLQGVYTAVRKDGTIYYRSNITYKSKHISLGSFDSELSASRAYATASTILLKETNSIEDSYFHTHALAFDKIVTLINFRDNGMYIKTPIYLRKNYFSYYLALKMNAPVDIHSLIRGALLHDYFLYDWHQKDPSHRLHGFRHPKTALGNAQRDYYLNWKEKNIIARHMFPLIPVPPQCREAWIVCLADKWCALGETMEPMFHVKHFK